LDAGCFRFDGWDAVSTEIDLEYDCLTIHSSGLDQSLISGANLYLPRDLGLTVRQNSLVNSAMPLGAVGGALLLSPANEITGRRMAIIISTILYTLGGALCAGSVNFGEF
jgi:MFS family permease